MAWHCAQCTRTNVRPRCAAGDWARTGLLVNERKAPSAMNKHRCPTGYIDATFSCPSFCHAVATDFIPTWTDKKRNCADVSASSALNVVFKLIKSEFLFGNYMLE